MLQTITDFTTFEISISQEYNLGSTQSGIDATPYFDSIDSEYIISAINLERVVRFTTFTYSTIGVLESRYLDTSYRISRNGTVWTDWIELEEEINNFPPFDPLDPMFIDIRFVRKGTKTDGSIRLVSFGINGILYQPESSDTIPVSNGDQYISSPTDIYKVFRIDDIEIISSSSLTDVSFKYRFSQDNSRTWSNWEVLTKENISTVRINPIRFFQIQYLIENNSGSDIEIQDINLIGDFQNVSKDYKKTNLYGIRDCCQSYLLSNDNGLLANTTGYLSSQSCSSDGLNPLTEEEKAKLYNPYQQTQAQDLLNKLSNDAIEVFGHKVRYFVTDPDGKGIDYTLHEIQLFNIICEGGLKVSVENNQFPDNQIVMNQFDLTLFDSFEIQITKQSFKTIFGVQRRPSKEDIVWFCDINRAFIVDHAQQFRGFNNSAIYYKVILKKYNKSANVISGSKGVDDRIKELTKNSTISELFGIEIAQDKLAVANKPQTQTLTNDPIRLEFGADLVKELIENSSTVISKQHYDFSNLLMSGFITLTQSVPAVTYKNMPSRLKISDNIGYYNWFRLNNYLEDEVYNLYHHYDENSDIGWKSNLIGDNIIINLNSDTYTFSFTGSTGSSVDLYENVWYCYVVNFNQRDRKLDQWIYKRNVDFDAEEDAKLLSSTELSLVYENTQTLSPVDYELDGVDAMIKSSDMKMTNIRLFNQIIPKVEHNKILNQYIIADDSKYLVFADNANTKITLSRYPYGTED